VPRLSDWYRQVADLGCLCCGSPAELHHPRGRKLTPWYVLPLCPKHHRGGRLSIHGAKRTFRQTWGLEKDLFDKMLEQLTVPKWINELKEGINGNQT